MSGQGFGPGSPKSFRYPTRGGGGDFDLEAGISRKGRKPKNPHLEASVAMRLRHFYEAHPVAVAAAAALLSAGLAALVLHSVHEARSRAARPSGAWAGGAGEEYPLPRLREPRHGSRPLGLHQRHLRGHRPRGVLVPGAVPEAPRPGGHIRRGGMVAAADGAGAARSPCRERASEPEERGMRKKEVEPTCQVEIEGLQF